MSLKWKHLPSIGDIFNVEPDTITCIHMFEEFTCVVLHNEVSCMSLRFSDWEWSDLKCNILETNSKPDVIFSCNSEVYMSNNKELHRLQILKSVAHEVDAFGMDTGSSNNETISWCKIKEMIGNTLAATGLSKGFATVEECSKNVYLVLHQINLEKPKTLLLDCPLQGRWFISSFKSSLVLPCFLQKLLKKPVYPDELIVTQSPNGIVNFFTSMETDPIEVLSEKDRIKSVAVSQKILIFLCETGKAIFVIFDESALNFDFVIRFLPTSVECSVLIVKDDGVMIVWSDGRFVFYTNVITGTNVDVNVFKTTLCGIFKMFEMDGVYLCCNAFGNFYEISIEDVTNPVEPFKMSLLKFSTLGLSVQDLHNQYNSLMCEQVDPSLIQASANDCTLTILNKSSLNFSKDIWRLQISCKENEIVYCQEYQFGNDLEPDGYIEFSLSKHNLPCPLVNLFFKGFFTCEKRLLTVNIGILEIKG